MCVSWRGPLEARGSTECATSPTLSISLYCNCEVSSWIALYFNSSRGTLTLIARYQSHLFTSARGACLVDARRISFRAMLWRWVEYLPGKQIDPCVFSDGLLLAAPNQAKFRVFRSLKFVQVLASFNPRKTGMSATGRCAMESNSTERPKDKSYSCVLFSSYHLGSGSSIFLGNGSKWCLWASSVSLSVTPFFALDDRSSPLQ